MEAIDTSTILDLPNKYNLGQIFKAFLHFFEALIRSAPDYDSMWHLTAFCNTDKPDPILSVGADYGV